MDVAIIVGHSPSVGNLVVSPSERKKYEWGLALLPTFVHQCLFLEPFLRGFAGVSLFLQFGHQP